MSANELQKLLNTSNINSLTNELEVWLQNNPTAIQSAILKIFEDRLNGRYHVADPNNSFMFVLEMLSENIALDEISRLNHLNSIFAKRADTFNDIYNNISDFEYVGLFATPSSINIELILDLKYLIKKGKLINDNQKLIRIPKDTIFLIGDLPFSLHHPIDIVINTLTEHVSVEFNNDVVNPLKVNPDHILNKRIYTENVTQKLLSFVFPIYQYSATQYIETIDPNLGFFKKYQYTGNFYAARVYHYDTVTDSWIELATTLSDFLYDTSTPTVKLKPYNDVKELHVELPLVYINNNDQLGNQLKVEIYTSLGNVDIDIVNLKSKDVIIDTYGSEGSNEYTSLLRNIPFIYHRCAESKISGGTDITSFDIMKDNIIYGSDNNTNVITIHDLNNLFNTYGFQFTKFNDDINDREFRISKKIFTEDNNPIEIINSNITFKLNDLLDCSTVNVDENSNITILPTTIYKFVKNSSTLIMLNEDERDYITNLTHNDTVKLLNDEDTTYVTYPYHLSVITNEEYSKVISYDTFDNTKINYLNVDYHHDDIKYSIDLISGNVMCNPDGISGYTIRVGVSKDKEEVSNNQLTCILTTTNSNNELISWIGKYDGYLESNKLDTYRFDIDSNFIFEDDRIQLTNGMSHLRDDTIESFIDFTQDWYVTFFIDERIIDNSINKNAKLQSMLPYNIKEQGVMGVNTNKLNITLVKSLEPHISNYLNIAQENTEYEKYEEDVPLTYTKVIYQHTNGVLDYPLIKLHDIGDPILDDDENQIFKYRKGDVKLDLLGDPIINKNTSRVFSIDLFGLNYKYKFVNISPIQTYEDYIKSELNIQMKYLDELYKKLDNNTKTSFTPISTMGAIYSNGTNDISVHDLRLSFKFIYHVPASVISDNKLQTKIKNNTIQIINNLLNQNNFISMSSIIQKLHDELTIIEGIESYGFNKNKDIGIIQLFDTNQNFMINTNISFDQEFDEYTLNEDIDIIFKPIIDNEIM